MIASSSGGRLLVAELDHDRVQQLVQWIQSIFHRDIRTGSHRSAIHWQHFRTADGPPWPSWRGGGESMDPRRNGLRALA
ncbi:unnamed protein product [Mycena citricolor]|uniref:Uncharacterized protein n=1 Tax=Mycena citricolor TaxID=2018698 RepID=A0AAD2HGW1_9AGAR|nr:unnamed protein product [Mycena citricolor]